MSLLTKHEAAQVLRWAFRTMHRREDHKDYDPAVVSRAKKKIIDAGYDLLSLTPRAFAIEFLVDHGIDPSEPIRWSVPDCIDRLEERSDA